MSGRGINDAAGGPAPTSQGGTVTWASGAAAAGTDYGSSQSFAGATQYTLSRIGASNKNSPGTIGCLCRWRTASTAEAYVYGEGKASASLGVFDLRINAPSAGAMQAHMRNDSNPVITASFNGGYNDGKWRWFHAVNEGNGQTLRLYV